MGRANVRAGGAKIVMIEPVKQDGKPCIRGLRITVYDVLEYLAFGMSVSPTPTMPHVRFSV